MADFALEAVIKANTAEFDKAVNKAGKTLSGFSGNLKSVTSLLGKAFAVASVVKLTKSLGDMSAQFAKATAQIAKGTGATGKALDNLSKSINESLINGIGRSAEEIGTMIADLNTRFGATGDELNALIEDFDKFASVTDGDTKTAINNVADVMAKWNIDAERTNDLLDQLITASQMSGASVEELSGALKSGSAILEQFGMNVTESIGFLASLKANGVETSTALTGMRTALSNFSKDGKDASEGMKEVTERIAGARTQAEAMQIAVETFGTRTGADMLKVLQSGSAGAESFTEALRNANGALERTDEASRTSKDALDDLKATVQGVFMTKTADNNLKNLLDDVAEAIRAIDFDAIVKQLQEIWARIKELFNNLIDALGTTEESFSGFLDNMFNLFDSLYGVVQSAFGTITSLLKGDWAQAWDYIKLTLVQAIKAIAEELNGLVKLIPNPINAIIDGYNKILEAQDKFLVEILHLPEAFRSVKLPTYEGGDYIPVDTFNKAIDEISAKIATATGKDTNTVISHLNKISKKTKKTTGEITGEIADIASTTTTTTETATKEISELVENMGTSWGKFKEQWEDDAKDWSDVMQTVSSGLGEIATEMSDSLVDAMSGNEDAWENMGQTALNTIAEILKALSAQLIALSAVQIGLGNYAKGALLAGASATALVSASALSAMTEKMDKLSSVAEEATANVSSLASAFNELKSAMLETGTTSALAEYMQKQSEMIADAQQNIDEAQKQIDASKQALGEAYQKAREAYSHAVTVESRELAKEHTSQTTINRAWNKYNTAKKAVSEAESAYQSALNNYENMLALYEEASDYARQGAIELAEQLNESVAEAVSMKEINDALYSSVEALKALKETAGAEDLSKQIATYSAYVDAIRAEQLKNASELLEEVYSEFSTFGKTIGESLMDAIADGASTSDFLDTMQGILRNNMLKLSIYTEEFTQKLADIGTDLMSAITSKSTTRVAEGKDSLLSLYEEATEKAKEIDAVLSEVFESGADTISDELSRLEQQIDSFKDTISDLGGDIASELISGLSDGLSESDFMESMYTWVRKMIVQTVVYTESMKSEIEQIGKSISEAMSNGFSETSLHEIRRDLSYLYYSASEKMSGIDSILDSVFSGYASGTENATRGLHLVGEAGPELVAFNGGERVYNADETRDIMQGAQSNSFNITFNNTQDTTAYAMMSQLRQYNREMAINGVL